MKLSYQNFNLLICVSSVSIPPLLFFTYLANPQIVYYAEHIGGIIGLGWSDIPKLSWEYSGVSSVFGKVLADEYSRYYFFTISFGYALTTILAATVILFEINYGNYRKILLKEEFNSLRKDFLTLILAVILVLAPLMVPLHLEYLNPNSVLKFRPGAKIYGMIALVQMMSTFSLALLPRHVHRAMHSLRKRSSHQA